MKIESGMRFGRYTVLSLSDKRSKIGRKLWTCKCDCGTIRDVHQENLSSGNSKSCGCLATDNAISKNTTHGLCYHPIHAAWVAMRSRCKSKDPHKARSYLNRGIQVCEEWDSFQQFYDDMCATWKEGLWLERINNDIGYSKGNCRWATQVEQSRNKRNNRLLCIEGVTKTMSEWASIRGIDVRRIHSRLKLGWSEEDAIQRPIRRWQ